MASVASHSFLHSPWSYADPLIHQVWSYTWLSDKYSPQAVRISSETAAYSVVWAPSLGVCHSKEEIYVMIDIFACYYIFKDKWLDHRF